jgi:arginyl-tRNA synthetase
LARVFAPLGHRVIRQNHLGEWGTQFGMLIEHLVELGDEGAERSMSELNTFYQAARKKFDDDADFAARSRKRVVLLQAGDPATIAFWKTFVDATLRHAATVYEKLGVTLRGADVAGESFYNPMLPEVVAELSVKGLATESDGALCVFPPGFSGRDGGSPGAPGHEPTAWRMPCL